MTLPLMPKATAVWLIDKTALTFTQIAEFCGMHPLEVQAIADGEVAQGINGYDPVANSQVTAEEIARCEKDSEARLKLMPVTSHTPKKQKGARYTPVAKRNDRPDGIAFVLRNYPQLSEAQVIKLLGTTKDTIQKVRDRQHWNSPNIKPRDPVILGLYTQTDLNAMVTAANDRLAREGRAVPPLPMPEMPKGEHVREGILRGIYRFNTSDAQNEDAKLRVQLLGSGTIMYEVLKAQTILKEKYGVAADVWSVTSYKELYRNANDCERWNMLHPGEAARIPFVTETLKDAPGPFIAASDYMKVLPESLAKWVPGQLVALGTDGFGRSENREALRDFFEVDAKHIVLATLGALAREKKISLDVLKRAVGDLGIDAEKMNPATS